MVRLNSHQLSRLVFLALLAIGVAATTAIPSLAQAPGTWTTTGSMNTARTRHTATLLPNGKVLVAGGFNQTSLLASAELYDPATGKWTATGSMTTARWGHSATLLPNGEVLVAGGSTSDKGSAPTAEAELYNPVTGKWTTTGSMTYNRERHGAALLANGQVLVAGGNSNPVYPGSLTAELYNPTMGKWTVTGSLKVSHIDAGATLLQDGRVLMAGGVDSPSADLYSNSHWQLTIQSNYSHLISRTALLTNSDVLVIGGGEEFYDPANNSWATTGPVGIRLGYSPLTRLFSGKVLVAGGQQVIYRGVRPTAQCALYDASTNSWMTTGSMTTPRSDHTTTLLPNGRVLAVGGTMSNGTGFLASTELYTP
jgi:hypothetical protein